MPRQNIDTSEDIKKKYSAAYSMGRELLLEPKIIWRRTYAAELYRARQDVA